MVIGITLKIAIVYFPYSGHTIYKFLSNLISILEPICFKIVIIGGNVEKISTKSSKILFRSVKFSLHNLNEISPKFFSVFIWILKILLIQILQSFALIRDREKYDLVIFYMAYPYYILPLITVKLIGKKTMEVITRSPSSSNLSKLLALQDFFLFCLLNGISPESKRLIKLNNLYRFSKKLLPEGSRYIDTNRYYISKLYKNRNKCVGFISRIIEEKGITEFIGAIKIIAQTRKDINFIIIGSGNLLPWVQQESQKIIDDFNVTITVMGYVKEEDIPNYLNDLKLLVLPTKNPEGLPTIILEAIFCGTPVLSTMKGSIQDIIKDESTGFILENPTKERLGEKIVQILDNSQMDYIIHNSLNCAEHKFTYNKAVERWKNILLKLEKK